MLKLNIHHRVIVDHLIQIGWNWQIPNIASTSTATVSPLSWVYILKKRGLLSKIKCKYKYKYNCIFITNTLQQYNSAAAATASAVCLINISKGGGRCLSNVALQLSQNRKQIQLQNQHKYNKCNQCICMVNLRMHLKTHMEKSQTNLTGVIMHPLTILGDICKLTVEKNQTNETNVNMPALRTHLKTHSG